MGTVSPTMEGPTSELQATVGKLSAYEKRNRQQGLPGRSPHPPHPDSPNQKAQSWNVYLLLGPDRIYLGSN